MTARLVLLNGPPGIGKSTIARRYADDHPLALCLDLDSVRRLLGRWDEHPIEAGLLARAMSVEMARAHLSGRHDVVIPQYLGRPQFVADLETVAQECAAGFYEFVLMDGRDESVRRFLDRTGARRTRRTWRPAGWSTGSVAGPHSRRYTTGCCSCCRTGPRRA